MISTEMLKLIVDINSLQVTFQAEQFSGCVLEHLQHSQTASNLCCTNKSHPIVMKPCTHVQGTGTPSSVTYPLKAESGYTFR